MKVNGDVLKHPGMKIEKRSRLVPTGDEPRLFDRHDITLRVYNQFAIAS